MSCWIPSRMAVSGDLAEEVSAALRQELPELQTRVVGDGALCAEDLVWADSYSGFTVPENIGASQIRWVHLMAAGVDRAVPTLAALAARPMLTRTVGAMPEKIAAYVVGHVLADLQRLSEFAGQQREARWEQVAPYNHVGTTAVIMGTGRIGSRISSALRAVGFRTVGVSRSGEANGAFDEVVASERAQAELATCALLVCALPLTETTRDSVGSGIFGHLHDAVFVNIGRGATVVESDLRAALEDGAVRRAVLDVFQTEPLPADSWMWRHDRVTVTPHIAGITDVTDVLSAMLPAYADIASGRTPAGLVDFATGY